MEKSEIPTICAWCPDLTEREEAMAETMGITRKELLETLSHGICDPCIDNMKAA